VKVVFGMLCNYIACFGVIYKVSNHSVFCIGEFVICENLLILKGLYN